MIIITIVLTAISSRCIVKLYSRQKQVFVYMYLLLHIRPTTPRAHACRSILVQARTDASFVRETGDGRLMRVTAYFATPPVVVNDAQDYNIDTLQANLEHKVEQWNKRGSNFNIERVNRFVLSIHPYRPLHGSTFVRTPEFLVKKQCLINVQNNDEKCFIWSVLSAVYPAIDHPYRLSKYINREHSLNVEGLNFPVQTKQIPLFEKLNPPYPSTFRPSKRVAKGSRWNIAAPNANENTT